MPTQAGAGFRGWGGLDGVIEPAVGYGDELGVVEDEGERGAVGERDAGLLEE